MSSSGGSSGFAVSCPLPLTTTDRVLLGHGSGGKMTADLIARYFLPAFRNSYLERLDDQAVLPVAEGRLAFTTDAHVVTPLFFPGGDIGVLARPGDMALAVSTSGKSPNLVQALETARELGLLTIAFTGKDGGRLPDLAEYCFVVPSFSIHRIQETHVTLYHIVWDLVHVALGEDDVI